MIDQPTEPSINNLQPARQILEYFVAEIIARLDNTKNPSDGSFSVFADSDKIEEVQEAFDKAANQDFVSHGWGAPRDWNRKHTRCIVQYAPPGVSKYTDRIYRDLKTGKTSVEYVQNPVGKEFVEEKTRYHFVTERWIVYFGNNSVAVLSTKAAKRCIKSLRRGGKLIDASREGKQLYERWQHELNR